MSWSHYLKLIRIDDEKERKFYEIKSFKNNWSVRELQRPFDSALHTRLALSRDKGKVKELSEKGLILEKPKDAIKDPYILELGIIYQSGKTHLKIVEFQVLYLLYFRMVIDIRSIQRLNDLLHFSTGFHA